MGLSMASSFMRLAALLLSILLPAVAGSRVIAVDLDGMIHPVSAEIVGHAIDLAEREHDAAVLIRLNTPGGLLDATRAIDQRILAAHVPIITFVTPRGARAASAGFFILEAGNTAAMAQSTNTGAASPVLMGREMDPVMRSKVENDAAAALRGIVNQRGRNSDLAEKTVREAKAFTDKEALDNKLIDLVVADEKELLDKLHLGGAEVVAYQPSMRERLIRTIADPNIALILLVLGGLGIYLEFATPGLVFPGVAGGILAILGLSALSVLPINWTGAALLVLAVALFVLEAKFASHGVLGTGGTVAMILGAVLLIDAPAEMRIHVSTAIAVALPFALITIFLLRLVVRARANKALTGTEGLIAQTGEARTELAPRGTVLVRGEYWLAESVAPIAAGAQVRVVAVEGLLLKVEPVG